jgi:hypothetical protein
MNSPACPSSRSAARSTARASRSPPPRGRRPSTSPARRPARRRVADPLRATEADAGRALLSFATVVDLARAGATSLQWRRVELLDPEVSRLGAGGGRRSGRRHRSAPLNSTLALLLGVGAALALDALDRAVDGAPEPAQAASGAPPASWRHPTAFCSPGAARAARSRSSVAPRLTRSGTPGIGLLASGPSSLFLARRSRDPARDPPRRLGHRALPESTDTASRSALPSPRPTPGRAPILSSPFSSRRPPACRSPTVPAAGARARHLASSAPPPRGSTNASPSPGSPADLRRIVVAAAWRVARLVAALRAQRAGVRGGRAAGPPASAWSSSVVPTPTARPPAGRAA